MNTSDTITAIATPPGRGGVAILRISGKNTQQICRAIIKQIPQPRTAVLTDFIDENGDIIDHGLALFFPGPHSFTGEDVVELHGHGGPVVMNILMKRVLQLGARMARPGEFSERAFINDKIDLTQAEAIADLINANSEQAARCAVRSLQGDFSNVVHALVEQLIRLRMMVEAAIDFPEEEIDFLSESTVEQDLKNLLIQVDDVLTTAQQGVLLQEGMTIVIAGKPNAGKSSLLNALAGRDVAIVTDIAGTTRDIVREHIHIDGLPLHVIDTAGLRESNDPVEQEGMRRAWQQIQQADLIILMHDISDQHQASRDALLSKMPGDIPVLKLFNKIDLLDQPARINDHVDNAEIYMSAKSGAGLDLLKLYLTELVGYQQTGEGVFIARERHVQALQQAKQFIATGIEQLAQHRAGELLAEDLRQAQQSLNEITGEFTSDDLLGRIFSSFCIGK